MNPPDDHNSDTPARDLPDLGADLQSLYGRRVEVPGDIDDRMKAVIAEHWTPATAARSAGDVRRPTRAWRRRCSSPQSG